MQADQGKRPAETIPALARVDADNVDLAQCAMRVLRLLAVLAVHLRPVEPDEPAIALGQEKAVGIEPRLLLPQVQVLASPCTLLGMAGERAFVELDPGVLVASDDEGPDAD